MTWYSLRRPNVQIRQPDPHSSTFCIVAMSRSLAFVCISSLLLSFSKTIIPLPRLRFAPLPDHFSNHEGTQKITTLPADMSGSAFEESSRVTHSGPDEGGVKGKRCLPIYHGQHYIDIEISFAHTVIIAEWTLVGLPSQLKDRFLAVVVGFKDDGALETLASG